MKFVFKILSKIVRPSSKNFNEARREFILNVLLLSSVVLSSIAFLVSFIPDLLSNTSRSGNSWVMLLIILLIFLLGLFLSKKGWSKIVSLAMVLFYFLLVFNA